jgi:ATP-dependent DNA ligase
MRLNRRPEPFNHAEWIFELKLDGFRALAYFENGEGRLVSRNWNTFASFRCLAAQVARKFPRGGCKVKGSRLHGSWRNIRCQQLQKPALL